MGDRLLQPVSPAVQEAIDKTIEAVRKAFLPVRPKIQASLKAKEIAEEVLRDSAFEIAGERLDKTEEPRHGQ